MAEQQEQGGARFLLAVIDGGGTVPPAMGLAAELVRRGHGVRVLADPTIQALAESAGADFTPWRDAPHVNSRAEQTAMIAAMEGRNPVRAFRALKQFAGKEMSRRFAGDVVATIREFRPDVVLADALPGILIGAQPTGLPTAALLAQTYLRPTAGLPLMGTGWTPGPGLRRVRDTLVPKAASWLLNRTLPRVNAVATSYGQPPLRDVLEPFDRCTRVLVMTSPSFERSKPDKIAAAVADVLNNPHYAAAARNVAGILAKEAATMPSAADEAEAMVRI